MKPSQECMLSMLPWLSVDHHAWIHGHANLANQFRNFSMYSESVPLLVKLLCMLDINQRKELSLHPGGEAPIPETGLKILPLIRNPICAVGAEFMSDSISTTGQSRENS